MVIAIWPLVVCVAGLILYLAATNAKPVEIGRITFMVGLLWLVYGLVGHVLHLGG
jgi:Na+/phosphate symporter